MRRLSFRLLAVGWVLLATAIPMRAAAGPPAAPLEGFVAANGVRLQYLDWGGRGPALILVHGLGANPRVFDDLAPAFTDRFRVIAYARRGSGSSDAQGPYDAATLTADLTGLMDALGIERANLVGHSAGGEEITELAAAHPERVLRLVYLDGAYDLAGEAFRAAVRALPQGFFDPPASALASFDAYRSYQRSALYPSLDDMSRTEANLRQRVVIQADGTLKSRMPPGIVDALYAASFANTPRRYAQVQCPALAIYADHLYDWAVADGKRRATLIAYEREHWQPFQRKSMERLQKELANVEVMRVAGAHASFFLTERAQVVDAMRRFLGADRASQEPGPAFTISFPASLRAQPVTGRVFVMISRVNEPEVRLQSHWFNSPQTIAEDVRDLAPGESVRLDGGVPGTPLPGLRDVPAGDYYVQAVLNVYTKFDRADGHVIWAHLDQGEGQQFNRSPGNLHSPVVKLRLDAAAGYDHSLSLSELIPPLPKPADTPWVKRIRFESPRLSRFWGRPIHLGAVVLLPRDYIGRPNARYPVIYHLAEHSSAEVPFRFSTDAQAQAGYDFYQHWKADDFPRMIAVSFQHPTPFADMSGLVNSANNGPYEDVLMQELIPHIEKTFRVAREPGKRVLFGQASAGRDALSLQLRHPEFFGGAWVLQPWAFDHRSYFALDIHANDNAFEVKPQDLPDWARNASGWIPVERYLVRAGDGTPIATFRQLSRHDRVMASAAGGEFGADDAMMSPVGPDGYPLPLWDRATGRIDRAVADHWAENYDLAAYAARNWRQIGPHLDGKIHLYAGDRDHFWRNEGVERFEAFLAASKDPHVRAEVAYGLRKGHWQPMSSADLVRAMGHAIGSTRP